MKMAEMDEFRGLTIVVPTRNRAELAMNAIRSVLGQDCPGVAVLVSDNSTDPEESRELAEFCRSGDAGRLGYMQPSEPLSMSRHWDWAIEEALRRSEASHFLYLTDRMLFRPDALRRLTEVLAACPNRVVSYALDPIIDDYQPVRVQQGPWTGQLYAIESAELLSLVSRSVLFHPAMPKMLNCAVPRSILTAVRGRFGTIFNSIAPDYNFCFRCLDVVEEVLYYDRPALLHYAQDRSNGMSLVRGTSRPAYKDFLATLGASDGLQFSTPIPELQTVGNAILHEYCAVRQETGSKRFSEVEYGPYVDHLAEEAARLENAELRQQMHELLAEHGWQKPVLGVWSGRLARLRSPQEVVRRLLWLSTSSILGELWLLLARRFGVSPPALNRLGFESREAALDFAIRFPPRKSRRPTHLPGRWRRVALEAGGGRRAASGATPRGAVPRAADAAVRPRRANA